MQREIERKFLVSPENFSLTKDGMLIAELNITQGYLSKVAGRIVRVRHTVSATASVGKKTSSAKMTFKLKDGADSGVGIDEYEYEIPENDGINILKHCEAPLIEKTRYLILKENSLWEVDVFHGHKEGLIVAEIELKDINDPIDMPTWIGEEVTGVKEYSNANM